MRRSVGAMFAKIAVKLLLMFCGFVARGWPCLTVGLASLSFSLAVSGADSEAESNVAPARVDAYEFAIGNIEFVLLHELAHLVITDKQVPFLGPVESVADYIATTVLVQGMADDENSNRRLRQFSQSAAVAFRNHWDREGSQGAEVPFWDTHALTIQRYYSVLCLLYGSNPETQQHLLQRFGLPQHRAASCPAEYAQAVRGLDWLVREYGANGSSSDPSIVSYHYGAPRSLQQQKLLERIRSPSIVENTVDAFVRAFALAEPFEVSLRSCGGVQASWNPRTRELILCQEMLDAFYLVGLQQVAAQ